MVRKIGKYFKGWRFYFVDPLHQVAKHTVVPPGHPPLVNGVTAMAKDVLEITEVSAEGTSSKLHLPPPLEIIWGI